MRHIAISLLLVLAACGETGPRKSILSQVDDAVAAGTVKSWTASQTTPDAGQRRKQ